MTLNTRITRGDEPLALRWGWWHVMRMEDAAILDGHEELTKERLEELRQDDYDYRTFVSLFHGTKLWNEGVQVLTKDVSFTDPSDGEVLELKAGDKLEMWRGYR